MSTATVCEHRACAYQICTLDFDQKQQLAPGITSLMHTYTHRKLLRFDSMTWNWGLADFKPTTSLREWEWHECHAHFHSMEEFAHYDLLYVNSRRRVAEGHKASFCLQDSRCARNYRRRFTCYAGKQGISPNCGDMYGRNLDCQWIDITGVRHNEYILQVSVNPNRIGLESDYENNQASCRIEIDDTYDWDMEEWVETVEVHECWQSGDHKLPEFEHSHNAYWVA